MGTDMKLSIARLLQIIYDRLMYVFGGILLGMLMYRIIDAIAITNYRISKVVAVASITIFVMALISYVLSELLEKGIRQEEENISD